jgi:dihydrodipicolinate synthase/N-acetylneuraminate lyase
VLSGWAPVIYPALSLGAAGGILAVANVLPDDCVALYRLAPEGVHARRCSCKRNLTAARAFGFQRARHRGSEIRARSDWLCRR